jgi:putative restriction endonuclease
MIDEIRNLLKKESFNNQWNTSRKHPPRKDVSKLIRTIESAKDAQLQLFFATEENNSIRCGLEVLKGDLSFRIRLAHSIREHISNMSLPDSLLLSEGATVCRLHDKLSANTQTRLNSANEFYEFLDTHLKTWIDEGFPTFALEERNRATIHRHEYNAFEHYLNEHNRDRSGKASSYLKAIELLEQMLQAEPYSFSDCVNLSSMQSVERLIELQEFVKSEAKKGTNTPWHLPDSSSYLRNGYCSAALTQLINFLPQHHHASKALDLLKSHTGSESELAKKLQQLKPEAPAHIAHDPASKDGKDRIRQVKTRIGQCAFREVILDIYNNRCCITGLDIPTVNRASHIIGWAERKDTRMDPRNGLCLSATYDAAFDRHLISLDDDYRIILSKEIKEHTSSESLQTYFLKKEGDAITLPDSYLPKKAYLEVHRSKGAF